MRGVFDDQEFESAPNGRDPELTLSNGLLLGLFFGLVLVCVLCFGIGYAVGHRSQPASSTSVEPASGISSPSQMGVARSKPSATAQPAVVQPSQETAVALPLSPAASAKTPENSGIPAQTTQPEPSTGQLAVKPALPPTASTSQPAAASSVHPALPPAASYMVQIASVSNPEDAEVLVNALRKRGYAVIARRDPIDELIHVRIGPFANRDEAMRWRQKLLSDGYNAMLQP